MGKELKKEIEGDLSYSSDWNPYPLTPSYIPDKHGPYVRKLAELLADDKVRNIALSGSYGTGKSSIIEGLFLAIDKAKPKSKRSDTNALTSLDGTGVDKLADLNKSLEKLEPIIISLPPLHASTKSEAEAPELKQATTVTNQIQREIVKRILYREDPKELSRSKFKRLVDPSLKQRLGRYSLVGLCGILLLNFLNGSLDPLKLQSLTAGQWWWLASASGILFIIFFSGALWLDKVFPVKPSISALSAGSAKIELKEKSVTYFDEYEDEIIYYFQKSGTNLVIFEDLDRYNDPAIFETLKELNDLINIALGYPRSPYEQSHIAQKGKTGPVRFIFATRDSALVRQKSQSGSREAVDGDSKLQRDDSKTSSGNNGTNQRDDAGLDQDVDLDNRPETRMKFFDAIIPVVPFATSRNAYEYLLEKLPSRFKKSAKQNLSLFETIGREIHDHRVLLNIVNEFVVFHEEIERTTRKGDQTSFLDDWHLFALIAFKAMSPRQFELISSGSSSLDTFFEQFAELKKTALSSLRDIQADAEKKQKLDEVAEDKAKVLGEQVINYCQSQENITSKIVTNGSFYIAKEDDDENTFDGEEILAEEFWVRYFTIAKR